ncbi:PTS transporter subunit EIIB [Spiroplasma diminutum]|uniref:PTS system trehalose-specific IIBC component n=1 Tax=Spiroplasma diminutum CUAS-1 TaxID=1276221 RepID=S5MEM3_9MOLU|nr:PTS transporter subunit EIIB [Spiroplasma diminutum]AGR42193.1 PTS system trehalose-specific IIBC component [Spiroplasma diminutum CUAS-1]
MKYGIEDVKKITSLVGGVENIEKVYHCMTRLRLILRDKNLFKADEIKKLDFVSGVILSSGEYQIIIGPTVNKFYELFCKENGLNSLPKLDINEDKELNMKVQRKSFLTFISQVFAPLLIILIAIGLWEMIRMPIFLLSNSLDKEWLNEWNDLNQTISRGMTYFVVIGVAWSTFKVMGGKEIYGLVIGVILCNPLLTALMDLEIKEGQTILEAMPSWGIFGDLRYPWKISFEGMVIPMVIVAVMGVHIQRLMQKVNLGSFRMLVEPVTVILLTSLISILTIAPLGLLFTSYLSLAFNFLMTHNITKYIFTPVIGALYSPMVIFGLHRTITPIIMQDIAQYQGSLILGLLIFSNVSTAIATFTFGFRYKNCKKIRQIAYSNATSGLIAGVTEPCIYSVGIKYVYPMIGAIIGTYFGCLLYTAAGVWTSAAPFGILGVIGFAIKAPESLGIQTWIGGNMLWGLFSMITTISISCIATLLLSKIKFFEQRTLKLLKDEYDFDVNKINEQVLLLKTKYKEDLNQFSNKKSKEDIYNKKILKEEYKKNIKVLRGA